MDDPDRSLLERFAQGDPSALEVLFRRFESDVYVWILRIVRDPTAAEDVLAESFWRAYRGHARFDVSRSFGAWMRRIATHAALDHLRSKRRHAPARPIGRNAQAPSNTDPELREAIGLAFRRLPPKLRSVASLALIEDRPAAEIADALGVPVGTVKSRLSRANARLRDELGRMGFKR